MSYNEAVFSSDVNKNDFIEYDYTFPTSMMSNGVVQYTSNAITFTGFKQFAIKVGLLGTNSANPSRVTDLRAIALQK
jgi:gamma-glutamylcysteine synthetase